MGRDRGEGLDRGGKASEGTHMQLMPGAHEAILFILFFWLYIYIHMSPRLYNKEGDRIGLDGYLVRERRMRGLLPYRLVGRFGLVWFGWGEGWDRK